MRGLKMNRKRRGLKGGKSRKKVGKFIQKRRKELGLNQDQVAKVLNYKDKQAISNIERGVAPLPFNRIKKLSKLLGIERKMLAKLVCLDKESDLFKDIEFVYHSETEIIGKDKKRGKFMVPVLQQSHVSGWKDFTDLNFLQEASSEYEMAETTDANAFYALVEDKHETSSPINKGDLLLVEPNHSISKGDLVLAIYKKEFLPRRYIKADSTIILQPLSHEKEPIIVAEGIEIGLFFIRGLKRKLNT
jgi:SOS-response transcriptional repressor LexA